MITLNNDINNDINTPITVDELVQLLNLQSNNIAIAVNEEVIRKSEWTTAKIKNNDRVDIVKAVGGG
ncbi:MAG: sulfur carrier protein ThiS [Dehalococcoidia bacterium]|jgi:sulfur carrier protein|tara:strand:+ start:415 stop:615 length:201 start_codon:yes stop_codon:yes gene_type:complete